MSDIYTQQNNDEQATEARWYVIHTYSGYENKVATNIEQVVANRGIQHMIQEVFIPVEKVTEIGRDGKEREVERKTFPGYVLVKMVRTNETWYLVRNIRGCTGFVGPDGEPVPLTDAEVERMGVTVSSNAVSVLYEVGDEVKVVSGAFEGYKGVVTDINQANRTVKINLMMFGRETPTELDFGMVVPLD